MTDVKPRQKSVSRRDFLKVSATAAGLLMVGCKSKIDFEAFFQQYFRELSVGEKEKIVQRLEKEYERKFGKKFRVGIEPALDGTTFAYGLDLSRCIGCRKCVYGCVQENNQSRNPQVQWIQVLEMDKEEGVNLEHADLFYNHDTVPAKGHFYMPVQCQQCRKPPCVKTCPVKATWQDDDGIVVIDYNWCIGCRCCMAACPYGARHFNWGNPDIPDDEVNPETHYFGNRPRMKGVVEKCTFCVQRVRGKEKRYPACVEACPVGARKFGNLLDPKSEIRYIIENKRVLIFKEEFGTHPKFYYFYGT